MKPITAVTAMLLAATVFAAPINVYVTDDGARLVDAFAYAWGTGGSIANGFDGKTFWVIKKNNHELKVTSGSRVALLDKSEITLSGDVLDFGGRPLLNQMDLEKIFGAQAFEAKETKYLKSVVVSAPISGASVPPSKTSTPVAPVTTPQAITPAPVAPSTTTPTGSTPPVTPTTPAAPKVEFMNMNQAFDFTPFRKQSDTYPYSKSTVSDPTALMEFCEMVIKGTLKAPATAIFTRPKFIATYTDGVYLYSGKVDAQNSYGALIRNDASCTIKVDGQNMLVYTWVR